MSADLELMSWSMQYPEDSLGLGDATEDVRSTAFLVAYVRIREFMWYQYQNGILDQTTWESYMAPTAAVFDSDLARRIWSGNVIRLAKADAWRSRFAEFTSLNAAYGVNPIFYHAITKIHNSGSKTELTKDEEALVNSFLISVLQIYEQLLREVKSEILDPAALEEFPGHSSFRLPYFREQWPFYRRILTSAAVKHLEGRYDLNR